MNWTELIVIANLYFNNIFKNYIWVCYYSRGWYKGASLRLWFVIPYYRVIFIFAGLERWLIYDYTRNSPGDEIANVNTECSFVYLISYRMKKNVGEWTPLRFTISRSFSGKNVKQTQILSNYILIYFGCANKPQLFYDCRHTLFHVFIHGKT